MPEKFLPTNPYIGTRDFYPDEMRVRNWFFSLMRGVAESFGYEEMLGPILEPFNVFAAKSGEEIVNEQVYHFTDRGERHMAIRPEMTPTVARMAAAKLGELRMPARWYSIANFMRYERPQKGRLREFWQLNLDLLGDSGRESDYEIIAVAVAMLRAFGADETMFKVKINNRRLFSEAIASFINASNPDEIKLISKAIDKSSKLPREKYEEWLKDSGLSPEQISRLDDLLKMSIDEIVGKLPQTSSGGKELAGLFDLIEKTGLSPFCEFDFSIVRGLDYYTGNVFEVYDLDPENRRALFGGGRYDNLVGMFKNANVSGIGFGFGDVTFQNFLEGHNLIPGDINRNDNVMITVFEDVDYSEYLKVSDELRAQGIKNTIYFGENKKMGRQFQYAEASGIRLAVIIGGDELKNGKAVIKNLTLREQTEVSRCDLVKEIKNRI